MSSHDMPLDTPPRVDPFKQLNHVAGWWSIRPTDQGDGRGYSGYSLTVKSTDGGLKYFDFPTLDECIEPAVEWCKEHARLPHPKEPPKKRVIKRQ